MKIFSILGEVFKDPTIVLLTLIVIVLIVVFVRLRRKTKK